MDLQNNLTQVFQLAICELKYYYHTSITRVIMFTYVKQVIKFGCIINCLGYGINT